MNHEFEQFRGKVLIFLGYALTLIGLVLDFALASNSKFFLFVGFVTIITGEKEILNAKIQELGDRISKK